MTKKIEQMLLDDRLINEAELAEALEKQKTDKRDLLSILVSNGAISEADMLKYVARKLQYNYVEDPSRLVDPEVKRYVPESLARAREVVPTYLEEGTLFVASSNPMDYLTLEDISMISGLNTTYIVSPKNSVNGAINKMYSLDTTGEDTDEQKKTSDAELMERVEAAPIVKLVNSLFTAAYEMNASDIHIDPERDYTRIRMRVDGILRDYVDIRKELTEPVTTRIKIISGMNIAEKRIPQDGAYRFANAYITLDLRVASIPTAYGEKMVMRLLGADRNITYDFDKLDINQEIKKRLEVITKRANGILLVTGPTGSGKSTTLYTLLNKLSTRERNVITVEDPVERHFQGITQVQINEKAGLSFASGLRSILRLDPDIIMVGEIRDAETASIAIRAAITGHLVLSTLHTNDAISSIVRLIDMGVEPYMVAASVRSIIAQRLVRRICPKCQSTRPISFEDRLLLKDDTLTQERYGTGCANCTGTGYVGRIAVMELVDVDETMQEMISNHATTNDIETYAREHGAVFLRDDVVRMIREGITTVEEARRILYSE